MNDILFSSNKDDWETPDDSKMKLTKEQKNQIYNKNMCVDDWEWVPCINHVLRVLNYDDILEHDENYEKVEWSGTELQIKDNK